jgi:hypothetical protein
MTAANKSKLGPTAALTASGNPDLLKYVSREGRKFFRRRERTADNFEMGFKAAAIRGRRATLRQPGKGFSIPLSMLAVVAFMSLAGCDTPGSGDLGAENEGSSIAAGEGVADPNAEIEVPEEKAPEGVETKNAPENLGTRPDTMISTGRRRAPVTTAPSDGVDWGADRLDSDAKNRLTEQEMRLQGRIDTLDRQLKAFDTNPPSRAARESDPRGRPEVLERRLDVERETLKAQVRQIRRELRWLRMESSPTSTGPGSVGTSAPNLFGGSGMQ